MTAAPPACGVNTHTTAIQRLSAASTDAAVIRWTSPVQPGPFGPWNT
nr:hypothetical protein JVH1_4277 [Rhodococcus sp. JVH1]